ncbi:MAG: hypothetical protein AAFZ65_01425 [Planctomycetota bacterium]
MTASNLAQKLTEVVNTETVVATVREMFDDYDQQQVNAFARFAIEKAEHIAELAVALPDKDDEEDLYRSITQMWMELRFEWDRHNQVMNYQIMKGETPDPMVQARGCVVSAVIHSLETFLDEKDLEEISSRHTLPIS